MSNGTSRRSFLKGAAAVAASWPVLRHSVLRAGAAGERLQLAAVGVGGMMGWTTLTGIAAHPKVDVVALCDVDEGFLNKAAAHYPKARKYFDWREMLGKEEKAIDAVMVATPDHTHAAIAMPAMRMGKHVFCQKPLAHDVWEARQMRLAAAKHGVVTQMGTQHASGMGDRMAAQLIQEGVIGKVREVYMWSNRPGVAGYRLAGPRPVKEDAVPGGLKWDLWLGGAPARGYAREVYHPGHWRTWQDFGTGWQGDIGCHIGSAVFKGLGLTAPTKVAAQVEASWAGDGARRREVWPRWQMVEYEYPGTEMTGGRSLKATWMDGEKWPLDDVHGLFERCNWPAECAIFLGEAGHMMLPHGSGPQLFPSKQFKELKRPKLGAIDHYQSWVEACIRGERKGPVSHFDFAGPLAESVLLGTVAVRCPDRVLEWDSEKVRVSNCEEANGLLKRRYREGWEVEGV